MDRALDFGSLAAGSHPAWGAYIYRLPLAGLNHRFNWSPHLGVKIRLTCLLPLLFAYVLISWAMADNKFFFQQWCVTKRNVDMWR